MAINTDTISNLYSAYSSSKTSSTSASDDTSSTSSTKKTGNYGKTIGEAKLSDEAAKYYEELKKKYSNMDFILVSSDQKENAQANASSYANASKMVVLIDEDKIEKMATDEEYRKKYESVIESAASGLSQLQSSVAASGQSSNVLGYGMQINDNGTSSYFAVLKQSSQAQKERIEKKQEENRAEAKEEAKEAKEEQEAKRLENAKASSTEFSDDTITISANSVEELMQKISDYYMEERTNQVQTESEKMVGQTIDFRG